MVYIWFISESLNLNVAIMWTMGRTFLNAFEDKENKTILSEDVVTEFYRKKQGYYL